MAIATQVRMDEEMYQKIRKIADSQQRSINKQIIFALENFVRDYERVNGKIELESETQKTDYRTRAALKKR